MKNKYEIIGDIIKIYINSRCKNYECIIDKDDFNKVCNIKTSWCLLYNKGRIESVVTKIQTQKVRKSIKLHQLIMNNTTDLVIDHINGNVLDNRKENLRLVTVAENNTNVKDYHVSSSGYQNIYLEKDGKYAVRIKPKRYGRYNTLEEAIRIRDEITINRFPLRYKLKGDSNGY